MNTSYQQKLEKDLADKDYKNLFLSGCCFHFAIRAFERRLGNLHQIKGEPSSNVDGSPTEAQIHVFVMNQESVAFDFNGRQTDHQIIQTWRFGPISEISYDDVMKHIDDQKVDDATLTTIYSLADEIITANY